MGKKGGSTKQADQARADEQARQQTVRDGTTRVNSIFDSQFNDDYFGKQKQNYIDYATPQVDEQYGDANKQLTFALTRAGLLDSSVRSQKSADLQKQYDLQKQQVADQALSYEGQAKGSVEDARGNLISTLNSTADADGAANGAISRASALSAPTAYSPLTNLFTDFTSSLNAQATTAKANAASTAPQASLFLVSPKAVVNRP